MTGAVRRLRKKMDMTQEVDDMTHKSGVCDGEGRGLYVW